MRTLDCLEPALQSQERLFDDAVGKHRSNAAQQEIQRERIEGEIRCTVQEQLLPKIQRVTEHTHDDKRCSVQQAPERTFRETHEPVNDERNAQVQKRIAYQSR